MLLRLLRHYKKTTNQKKIYHNLVTIVVSKLVKLLNWRQGGNVINHISVVIVLSVASEHFVAKRNYVNWILNTRDLEMDIR